MPYIIITAKYPSEKAKEVAERYIEVTKKYPPDDNLETPVVPVAVKSTEQGIKVITVGEVKTGKLEEVLTRAANALAMFNDISGYESTTDIYMTLDEGMATIGMSMPG